MSLISPIGTSSWSVSFLPGRLLTSSIGAVIALASSALPSSSSYPVGLELMPASMGLVSASSLPQPPTFADVEAAARRLAGVAHRTPVITSRLLDEELGCQAALKAEGLQRMGAFKFRR